MATVELTDKQLDLLSAVMHYVKEGNIDLDNLTDGFGVGVFNYGVDYTDGEIHSICTLLEQSLTKNK